LAKEISTEFLNLNNQLADGLKVFERVSISIPYNLYAPV